MTDLDIDAFLSELTRLETLGASRGDTPEALQAFSVCAPSPLAPVNAQLVSTPREAAVASPSPSPFVLPPLPSAFSDPSQVQHELQAFASPSALFGDHTLAAGALHLPSPVAGGGSGSRLLAQVAMVAPQSELVPKRECMVLRPLELTYEYRSLGGDSRATSVVEGFSEAMKKQDEYAKQNVGKQPFAPGGNALTTTGQASVAAPNAEAMSMEAGMRSEDERALEELLLRDEPEAEGDDIELARLTRAILPGLNGFLTLEDVRNAERKAMADDKSEETAPSTGSAAHTMEESQHSVLQPYLEIASDQDAILALKHSVAHEKAMTQSNAERRGGGGTASSGVMALDELLRDMEDDDELTALGFELGEENETNDGDQKKGAADSAQKGSQDGDHDSVGNVEASNASSAGGAIASEEEASTPLDPEAEVELMLSQSLLLPTSSGRAPTKTEWASIVRADVRNFHDKVPEMAIQYPFELDTFQKECVLHLERHECVFVAAHTSAGKTVVAEYAIAMSQKHLTRTIYTSPIKALSNQKYRDFRTKFGPDNVGLITGDVSLNPEASCLVMTTEILRSMLYRGADVIRDIEWVIFDEIHYINDSERGVVWEEVIIMLPPHVGMVFLSATTPNHLEFSDWIGRTKRKKIHVISTYKRPVPLQHFLYAGKDLFKIFDAATGYNPGAYMAAKNKLFPASDNNRGGGRGGGSATGRAGGGASGGRGGARTMGRSSGGDQSDWTKLISSLRDKTLLPVVVFAFSKRLCEESASKLNKLDLSTPSERSEIHVFVETSIQRRLRGSDRALPQVLALKEMLARGIGVHHGGLLPILKELVEILFARGLVKVLFATETFAMGVNMPARTVVFNGIRKHDGKNFRDLLPGEYTQMAGRAGRRGLDAVGTVIIACWSDQMPEPTALQVMLAGKATSLSSQFRLTYTMILNLLRVEVLTVEDMMKRSFSEFHTQRALAAKNVPQLLARAKRLLRKLQERLPEEYPHLEASGELSAMRDFAALKREKCALEKRLVTWLLTHHALAARTAIAPGRVVAMSVRGLPSAQLALVVRTSTVHDGQVEGHRELSGGDSGVASRAQHLFKNITVICLCDDQYTPPASSSTTTSTRQGDANATAQGKTTMHGAMLLGKKQGRDDDDSRMMGMRRMGSSGGGKKMKKLGSRGADLDVSGDAASALVSSTTGSLLGRTYAVLDIPETCLDAITDVSLANRVNITQLVASSSTKELATVVELLVAMESGTASNSRVDALGFVDVVHELKVHDLELVTAFGSWQQLDAAVRSHPCAEVSSSSSTASSSTSLSRVLRKVEKMCKLDEYVTRLSNELSNASLALFPDFQQRLRVLEQLGYVSSSVSNGDGTPASITADSSVVEVKGRVACEINTCDELVLTELVLENVLAALEPEEIVAVLSALIFQGKTQNEPTLTPRLEAARDRVRRIAESLGVLQLQQHLEIDPAVYCKNALNFGLMEVVYEWARGMPFNELCQLTDVQEGAIVRTITRLDEVCREVRNAARVIGDPSLFRKMEVASESIKRDVVFATSLYLA